MFMRSVSGECQAFIFFAWLVTLSACSVYDADALPRDPSSREDGGSDQLDARVPVDTGFGDTAPPDDGSDASFGPDAAPTLDCRTNPDASNTACPEICPEACNGHDDDCDGEIDESADSSCAAAHASGICQDGLCFITRCLSSYRDCDQLALTGCEIASNDPNHCGACGRVCNIPNAMALCNSGKCVVDQCGTGYGDCDADGTTCETRTNSLVDCGGCGVACRDLAHAIASCETGSCGVSQCEGGYGDCDKDPANGCERALDTLQHCGGCDVPCNKAGCGGGACTAANCSATPGSADCDHDEASCEINLLTDANNCGACGFKCQFAAGITPRGTLTCTPSGCSVTCDAGYGNCDGNYTNGCEQQLNTLTHCGSCGQNCAINDANVTCSTGSCRVQSCKPDHADCNGDQLSCETALNTPSNCGSCNSACNLPHANEGCGGAVGARVCTVASCEANWSDCDVNAANGCERDSRSVGSGGLGPCLPDTSCSKSTSAGHDYFVCPTARTWSDARSKCQAQAQGDLLQIADATENNFIKARLSSTSWTGHNDSAREGLWVWSSNNVPFWRGTASGSAVSGRFSSWASGEPNASGDCGTVSTSGGFDDNTCSVTLPFVCEVSPDVCPSDATKLDPGQCGCGTPDTDSDSDGFADCADGCPNDANKTTSGACGCGVADTDGDGDGTANCIDGCASDPNKTAPGTCGCGNPETDTDSDGTRDCAETCDNDPLKQMPGTCGCGIPENCTGVISALTHRYRFQGTGTTLTDSTGTAHGTSKTALTNTGSLALLGNTNAYATLPAGLLSATTSTTLEFWMTWQGGGQRQRVISFGTATPTKPSNLCGGSASYFSGSWYHFCGKDGSMSWSKSRGLCEGAGGYLAAIESLSEDQYLDSHASFTESVWIGANDLQTEGQWYFANSAGLQGGPRLWTGDENGSAYNGAFTDWRIDEAHPNDNASTTDCSFLHKPTSKWMSYGCEFDGSFVCEWRGHQGSAMNRGVSFTPADASNRPSLTYQAGASPVTAQGSSAFPTGTQTHVALVLEPGSSRIALYINGALVASVANSDALANLRDVDNWLGRSHVSSDPALSASLSEFRIYGRALTTQELATSHTAGPDPAFLGP